MMVAYSFKRRFVEPIRWGLGLGLDISDSLLLIGVQKRQTIRANRTGRSRHARPGEHIQLYYGMRTKQCGLIGVAKCVSVTGIRIQVSRGIISIDDYPAIREDDLDAFAQKDGFVDWKDMRAFWEAEHGDVKRLGPWTGVLIRWEPIT